MKLSNSDKEKILKQIDKISYPDNLSRLIAKSFSPQLALVDNFQKQIEEAVKHQNRLINSFGNSFVDSLAKQMEVLSKSANVFYNIQSSIFTGLEQHMKRQMKLAESLSVGFTKMVLPQINLFDSFAQQIADSHKNILQNLSVNIVKSIGPMQSLIDSYDLDKVVQQINILKEAKYEMNFGQSVILSIDDIKRQRDYEQVILTIEELLKTHIEKNPKSIVASSSFQNLLYFLLSIIIAVYLSNQQEANIIRSINDTSQRIEKKIEEITPKKDDANIYIVRTKLNVRKGSNSKSLILDTLFQNNKVEVVKEENDWFYVEYFDFVEGLPKTGWVYSKYLVKVNNIK